MWLHANGIQMEQTSDTVAEGKLIGEISYPDRAKKFTEIEVDGIKIDFFDAKKKVIHEVKKSPSIEQATIAQVKYYIYKLAQKGIEGVTGIIEYPKLRLHEDVSLSEKDKEDIISWEDDIQNIVSQNNCPDVIRAKICKSCSYHDFCYSTELD